MIQLTLTLKLTTAQVVETSVTVNNSPIQDYVHPDDQIQPTCTFEMTPGFKTLTIIYLFIIIIIILIFIVIIIIIIILVVVVVVVVVIIIIIMAVQRSACPE